MAQPESPAIAHRLQNAQGEVVLAVGMPVPKVASHTREQQQQNASNIQILNLLRQIQGQIEQMQGQISEIQGQIGQIQNEYLSLSLLS